MADAPVLVTERLRLRWLDQRDLPRFCELAGAPEVFETTLHVPSPYTIAHAREFMEHQRRAWERGQAYLVAIAMRESDEVIGAIGLELRRAMDRGELGFWVGVPYWNRGYATEAAGAVLGFGFEHLRLNRIWAGHFAGNEASGRVQQKLGMKFEGVLRQALKKGNTYHDDVVHAVLREEFEPKIKWEIEQL